MNHLKTLFLMVLLTLLLLILGQLIAGQEGLVFAFIVAMLLNFFAYWFSDRIAVAMTRSRPLDEKEAPQVYQAVRELIRRQDLPMPRIFLMPVEQPNAFAAGRNPRNAVISVTRGLLNMLDYEELKGVLAHELAHIRNRDILISTVAAVMAGALMFIGRMGMWGMMFGRNRREGGGSPAVMLIRMLALILVPLGALLIRLAISRTREYQADATAAQMSGNSDGLAGALLKMESHARRRPLEINEAASHMFIINPLSAKGLSGLFSTHPPIKERVERLRQVRL